MGSGCGSVGRVVASNARSSWYIIGKKSFNKNEDHNGLEPGSSGARSNHSAKCARTTTRISLKTEMSSTTMSEKNLFF